MKKGFAALLFLIIFTSQVGYYFIYTIHQHILKEKIEKELMAAIPESSLDMIVAEQYGDKIRWEEKNKEFSLDGVMYDIVKIRRSNGKTFLYCINDKKEKQLLDELAKAANGNHNNKQEKNSVKSFLPDLVCINHDEDQASFSVPLSYSSFNSILVSSFEEINSPPPKA